MNFKSYKCDINKNHDFYDYNTKLIQNYENFEQLSLTLDEISINKEFFDNNFLIHVCFFDGSVPERFIKRLEFNDGLIHIYSNKEDITFSTMDYRMHNFIVVIDKMDIDNILLD